MTASIQAIYPKLPYIVSASLAAVTACSTRAPTAVAALAAANIFLLVPIGSAQSPVNAEPTRIDRIHVQACSSSITNDTVAQVVTIWECDGVTAWPIDEILVSVVDASTVLIAFQADKTYADLVLPTAHSLYISTTVTTTASTTALCVTAFGGTY